MDRSNKKSELENCICKKNKNPFIERSPESVFVEIIQIKEMSSSNINKDVSKDLEKSVDLQSKVKQS